MSLFGPGRLPTFQMTVFFFFFCSILSNKQLFYLAGLIWFFA